MAEGGRLLAGTDIVTDQLLVKVAHHVIIGERKTLATGDMRLDLNQYDRIEVDKANEILRNMEVGPIWTYGQR